MDLLVTADENMVFCCLRVFFLSLGAILATVRVGMLVLFRDWEAVDIVETIFGRGPCWLRDRGYLHNC